MSSFQMQPVQINVRAMVNVGKTTFASVTRDSRIQIAREKYVLSVGLILEGVRERYGSLQFRVF